MARLENIHKQIILESDYYVKIFSMNFDIPKQLEIRMIQEVLTFFFPGREITKNQIEYVISTNSNQNILLNCITNSLYQNYPTLNKLNQSNIPLAKDHIDGILNIYQQQLENTQKLQNDIKQIIQDLSLEKSKNSELSKNMSQLVSEFQRVQSIINQLQTEKNQLRTILDQVQSEKNQLQTEKNQLQSSFDIIQLDNKQLQSTVSQLQTEKNQLQTIFNQLQSEKNQLQSEKNQLQSNFDTIQLEKKQLQSTISQLQSTISQLQFEKNQYLNNLNKFDNENKQLHTNYNNLQSEINQLLEKNKTLTDEVNRNLYSTLIFQNLQKSDGSFFFLYHLSQFIHNYKGHKGNRWNSDQFSSEIVERFQIQEPEFSNYFYGLLSFLPNYWFNIIQQIFHLPSYKTCFQKRNDIIKNNLSLHDICCEIDDNDLQKYIEFYWGPITDLVDKRVLLVIDAAALSLNAGFNPRTHQSLGFIDNVFVEPNQDLQELLTKYKIAKDVFVIMLCPLDPDLKPIVIYRKYTTNGLATLDEIEILTEKKRQITAIGLQYIGTASDGDPQYFRFSKDFADKIIQLKPLTLSVPLFQLTTKVHSIDWFQDILHILKCDRYTLIKGKQIRILASSNRLHLPYNEFQTVFSTLQKNVLNNSSATKMDDNLVFVLFNWTFVKQAMIKNHLLIPILLPPALLLQIFYNPNICRNDRYYYLNIAAALIFIQYASLSNPNQIPLDNNESFPINYQDFAKCLSLSASIAPLFLDKRRFDLADCTSHLLEHFFGLIRRFCAGNNSMEKFEQSMQKAICLQTWLPKLGLQTNIPGRYGQDHGAIVEEGILDPLLQTIPFGAFVRAAYNLFEEIFNENHIVFSEIYTDDDILKNDMKIKIIIEEINIIDFAHENHTAKQAGLFCSGGYINIRQHCEAHQADVFLNNGKKRKARKTKK